MSARGRSRWPEGAAFPMSYRLHAAAFSRWLDRYREAWETRDPAGAGALFTEHASYRETPFDPPFEGRSAIEGYWARVTAGQQDVRFSSSVLACADADGVCRWQAVFLAVPAGDRIEVDGIFRCRFAEEAMDERFEEWWHIRVTPAA